MSPRVRSRRIGAVILAAPLLIIASRPAVAHDFTITRVDARFTPQGAFRIDLICDLDELALGLPRGSNSAEVSARLRSVTDEEFDRLVSGLRTLLQRRLRVLFDGQAVDFEVEFPECIRCAEAASQAGANGEAAPSEGATRTPALSPALSPGGRGSKPAPVDESVPSTAAPPASQPGPQSVIGITARLAGKIPADAKQFSFRASRSFSVVHLTIHPPPRGRANPPPRGGANPPAGGASDRGGTPPGEYSAAAAEPTRYVLPAGEECPPFDLGEPPPPLSAAQAAWRYLRLGYEHILPLGLDHVLFVLALYLLAARWRPLLWQVTAFTLAHSVTLALSMYGVFSLPSTVVEPLIALSIACVGIENLLTARLHPWRPAIVFGFGLLHGLGFAGALTELGLPREQFVTALLAFNVGVELGQLSVIALAFAAIGWCRKRPWYRRRVVIPLSLAVSAVALYWFAQRVGWLG